MKAGQRGSSHARTPHRYRSVLRGTKSIIQSLPSRKLEHALLRMPRRAIRAQEQMDVGHCCVGVSPSPSITAWSGGILDQTIRRGTVWSRSGDNWSDAVFWLDRENTRSQKSALCLQSIIWPNRICHHRDQASGNAHARRSWFGEDGSRRIHASRGARRVRTRSRTKEPRRRESPNCHTSRLSLDPSLADKKSPPPPPPPKPAPTPTRHKTIDSPPPNIIRPETPYPAPPPPPRKDK